MKETCGAGRCQKPARFELRILWEDREPTSLYACTAHLWLSPDRAPKELKEAVARGV